MSANKPNVGGQAVLEGVMMRSPRCFAVAVRRKAGQIVIREQPWEAAWSSKVAKIPFVRGAVTLFESMHNGYSALRFSAEQMEEDLADEEATDATSEPAQPEATHFRTAAAAPAKNTDSSSAGAAGTRLATVLALGFFIALPQILAWGVGKLIGHPLEMNDPKFHALTGVFKLALVLGYLLVIRRVPEVRRVFQYHGAEHKAIATYEAGQPLLVEHARKFSTRHARCGTTFLIVVVMVSVLVYIAVLPFVLGEMRGWTAQILGIFIKILLLPPIAGLAYELQRLGARFSNNFLARIMLTPGYWVQGITTIEPSDDQLEIALASLRVTLMREASEAKGESTAVTEPVVQMYPSYAAFATEYGGLSFSGG